MQNKQSGADQRSLEMSRLIEENHGERAAILGTETDLMRERTRAVSQANDKMNALDQKAAELRADLIVNFKRNYRALNKGGVPQISGKLFDPEKGLTEAGINQMADESAGPIANKLAQIQEKRVQAGEDMLVQQHVMADLVKMITASTNAEKTISGIRAAVSAGILTLTDAQMNELERAVANQEIVTKLKEEEIAREKGHASKAAALQQEILNLQLGEKKAHEQALAQLQEDAAQIRFVAIENLSNANNTKELAHEKYKIQLEGLRSDEGMLELAREGEIVRGSS